MARDVAQYCNHCIKCQTTKGHPGAPAPLQPVIASWSWELVAVDVLKVPMSLQGNEYILVAQDYFSKWPFAVPMPDQKAERIVQILKDQVFNVVGPQKSCTQIKFETLKATSFQNSAKHLGLPNLVLPPIIPWEMVWWSE